MNYYYLHGLKPIEPSDDIKFTTSVKVFEKQNLRKSAKSLKLK